MKNFNLINKNLLILFLLLLTQKSFAENTQLKVINNTKDLYLRIDPEVSSVKAKKVAPGKDITFNFPGNAPDTKPRVEMYSNSKMLPENFVGFAGSATKVRVDMGKTTLIKYTGDSENGIDRFVSEPGNENKEAEAEIKAREKEKEENKADNIAKKFADDFDNTTHRLINRTDKTVAAWVTFSHIKTMGIMAAEELATYLTFGALGAGIQAARAAAKAGTTVTLRQAVKASGQWLVKKSIIAKGAQKVATAASKLSIEAAQRSIINSKNTLIKLLGKTTKEFDDDFAKRVSNWTDELLQSSDYDGKTLTQLTKAEKEQLEIDAKKEALKDIAKESTNNLEKQIDDLVTEIADKRLSKEPIKSIDEMADDIKVYKQDALADPAVKKLSLQMAQIELATTSKALMQKTIFRELATQTTEKLMAGLKTAWTKIKNLKNVPAGAKIRLQNLFTKKSTKISQEIIEDSSQQVKKIADNPNLFDEVITEMNNNPKFVKGQNEILKESDDIAKGLSPAKKMDTSEITELGDSIKTYKTKPIHSIKSSKKQLKELHSNTNNKLLQSSDDVTKKIDDLTMAKKSNQQAEDIINKEIKDLKAQKEGLERSRSLEETKINQKSVISGSNRSQSIYASKLSNLKSEIDNTVKQIDNTAKQITELDTKISKLKSNVANLEKTPNLNQDLIKANNNLIKTYEDDLIKLKTQQELAESSLKNLSTQKELAENSLKNLSTQKSKIVLEPEDTLDNLTTKVDNLNSEIDDLTKKTTAISDESVKEISKKKEELLILQKKKKLLEENNSLKTLQDEISLVHSGINKKTEELSRLNTKLKNYELELQELSKLKQNLGTTLKATSSKNKRLLEEFESLSKFLDEIDTLATSDANKFLTESIKKLQAISLKIKESKAINQLTKRLQAVATNFTQPNILAALAVADLNLTTITTNLILKELSSNTDIDDMESEEIALITETAILSATLDQAEEQEAENQEATSELASPVLTAGNQGAYATGLVLPGSEIDLSAANYPMPLTAADGFADRFVMPHNALTAYSNATGGGYHALLMPGQIVWVNGGADAHNIFVGIWDGQNDEGYVGYYKNFDIYDKNLSKKIKTDNLINIPNKTANQWVDIYFAIDDKNDKIILKATEPYAKPTLKQAQEYAGIK